MSDDNSILVCFIFRKDGIWHLCNVSKFGSGKVFTECEDLIKNNLKCTGYNEELLFESKSWKATMGKKFSLKKDETILIPNTLKEIRIGLGWDTHCDIDASIICLNA